MDIDDKYLSELVARESLNNCFIFERGNAPYGAICKQIRTYPLCGVTPATPRIFALIRGSQS